jgi:two-component system KDP operon response regulator KdpE
MSLKVLLVEDDRELRATLRAALTVEGYAVLAAASLADARAQLAHQEQHGGVDLVLLDLGLPDGEGAQLLAELRKRSPVPVIIISARHDERPKIGLLDAGADDYLVKPFGIGELLARMRVTLRHRGTTLVAATTRYCRAGVAIDLETRQVMADGAAVRLTPTEFALLARLVRSAGRVVTHRQLLADVWGAEHVDNTQYLRLYMSQLRAKLERTPADPHLLLTEPGVGYRLADPDDE